VATNNNRLLYATSTLPLPGGEGGREFDTCLDLREFDTCLDLSSSG